MSGRAFVNGTVLIAPRRNMCCHAPTHAATAPVAIEASSLLAYRPWGTRHVIPPCKTLQGFRQNLVRFRVNPYKVLPETLQRFAGRNVQPRRCPLRKDAGRDGKCDILSCRHYHAACMGTGLRDGNSASCQPAAAPLPAGLQAFCATRAAPLPHTLQHFFVYLQFLCGRRALL